MASLPYGGGPYGGGPYGGAPAYRAPYDPTLADAVSRLGARIIDVLIAFALVVVAFVADAVIQAVADPYTAAGQAISIVTAVCTMLVIFVGPFAYEWLMTARTGATVGKRLMKIRVVNAADRSALTSGQAAGRAACVAGFSYIPVVSLLDQLWLLWDKPLQQCLHDKPVNSIVVRA